MGNGVVDIHRNDIANLLASGQVVPVVGSGVSTATANIPGWKGVIQQGLAHIKAVGTCTPDELQDAIALLDRPDLVPAAQRMVELLGGPGGEFPSWLKSVFEVDHNQVKSRLINSIVDLLCPVIATTNYDKLLSMLHYDGPQAVTWRQSTALLTALREGNKVIHLHGVYDDPESIILGIGDYRRLIRRRAYRDVLQSFWLQRTLLFIGCSFDGLKDPDFMRLLTWASNTFAGSPYKHYALLRIGDFTNGHVKQFLHDWRIQIVGYGSKYDDLPKWLEQANPLQARAKALRLEKAKQLLDVRDTTTQLAFTNLMESLARPDAPQDVDLAKEAQRLFEQRQSSTNRLRGDLLSLQRLARTIVDPAQINREIKRWDEHKRVDWDPPKSYYKTVLAAAEALFLFPYSLLAALHRRRIDVHQRVLDGYCKELVEEMKHGAVRKSEYATENMNRVLTSLKATLEIDPSQIFPNLVSGQILPQREATLVVVRANRIELRRLQAPYEQLAMLPMAPPGLSGAQIVSLKGENTIVAFNEELLIAWNPTRSRTPIAEYQIEDPYGINSIAHLQTPDGLRSVIATTSGNIYELQDLQYVRHVRVQGKGGFVNDIVLLPDGRLFALYRSIGELVEVMPNGEIVPILDAEDFRKLLEDRPGIPIPRNPRFGHWELLGVEFDKRTILALASSVRTRTHDDSVVAFLEPLQSTVELHAHYYIKDQDLSSFVIATGDDNVQRLVGALLSDFHQTYDLVVWARATATANGYIFIPEGSTVRTRDDMILVAVADPGHAFASDDSGGLFSFSMRDFSFAEIDRDSASRIQHLLVANW